MSRAWLICPCCGNQTEALWFFAWCRYCWYTVCGGDLASDWALSIAPSVYLAAEETA